MIVSFFLCSNIVSSKKHRCDAHSWKSNPERWKATEWESDWGEFIQDVKKRNDEVLMDVLDKYEGHNIVIGTHGTSLSTILDYLSPEYGYDDFIRMMDWMPNIVEIVFDKRDVVEINEIGHKEKKQIKGIQNVFIRKSTRDT